VLQITLILSLLQEDKLTLGSYIYPYWANQLAWGLCIFPILFIPLRAIYEVYTQPRGSLFEVRTKFKR